MLCLQHVVLLLQTVFLERVYEFKELCVPLLSSPQAPWRNIESYALYLGSTLCLLCAMKPAAVLLDHFDVKTH